MGFLVFLLVLGLGVWIFSVVFGSAAGGVGALLMNLGSKSHMVVCASVVTLGAIIAAFILPVGLVITVPITAFFWLAVKYA